MAQASPPSWIPDVNTTSRKDYTAVLVNHEIPANATEEYRKHCQQQQELLQLLHDDPAMDSNRDQTFMTPANSKNRVYFMWDFCQRNLVLMFQVDPTVPRAQRPTFEEIKGRVSFSSILITDTTGKVDVMFPGDGVTFSAAIKAKAAEVV